MKKSEKTISPKYIVPGLTMIILIWLVQFAMAAPPRQGEDIAIITNPPNITKASVLSSARHHTSREKALRPVA